MIHSYKLLGQNIIVDTESVAIHVTDDVAFDIINMLDTVPVCEIVTQTLKKYKDEVSRDEIFETLDDIAALKSEGKLFSDPIDTGQGTAGAVPSFVKALCLNISHACNMQCEYCFASSGTYSGPAELMSEKTAFAAIDFLVNNSGTRRTLDVDFFGGEPLLNWDVVKSTVTYARGLERKSNKQFRFTLTTNGLLIDEDVIEFTNREMHNVVLSLDGRPGINDKMRKTAGTGTHDLIVPNFKKLIERRNNRGYYIRGTYTRHNLDFTRDILHMLSLGFTELSLEPAVSSPDAPYALCESDLPRIFSEYEALAALLLTRKEEGRPFTFYHFMLDLDNSPCYAKRIAGCGTGSEYMAVTPDGTLFPCHQFVGNDAFVLGDVFSGIKNEELRLEFHNTSILSSPECSNCWAKLFCAGGCAANAFHANNTIKTPHSFGCRIFKKRLECAIALKCAQL